jgi:hypothetical protein
LLVFFFIFSGMKFNAVFAGSFIGDTLTFKGELSGWGIYSHKSTLPVLIGGRYIPTLDYGLNFRNSRKLDLEASLNIYGSIATHPFDTVDFQGDINAYRGWIRYSTNEWELRLGLQKISFGSATLLRPLMWFDQIDPRDPLQLTNGVWGLLSRYYFKNNANLWIWGLLGNKQQRPWDIGKTNQWIPEAGGRLQYPIPKGEVALSYHYRNVDTQNLSPTIAGAENVSENRIGFDGKIDLKVSLWLEGSWIHKSQPTGIYTNQEIFTAGIDYTFGIGNGLYVLAEQMLYSSDEHAFDFNDIVSFSGISLSYPIGIVDNISAIVYYDWQNNNAYNFINWNHRFKHVNFYLMAYWNPDHYNLPQSRDMSETYAGPGLQVMIVYNH